MGKTKKLQDINIKEILMNYSLYIILGVMLITVVCIEPAFLSINNITNILAQASTRGFLALGVAGIIVICGTDLSAGRILGCCAAISASLVQAVTYAARYYPNMTKQLPLIVPLAISVSVAVLFCLINGFGVAFLHMHAFIVTLGTQLMAYGACCIYIENQPAGAQPLSTFDPSFIKAVKGSIDLGVFKIPYLAIYFLIAAVIMYIIWNHTILGMNMFALGGNIEAATVSGINIKLYIMLTYIMAGVLYGIAAFLEAGRIGSVNTTVGFNYEFDAISGSVIGGVSWAGGIGTIPGVVVGVIILQTINYSLVFLDINPYLQYIIKGLIIIVAVAIDVQKYLTKK